MGRNRVWPPVARPHKGRDRVWWMGRYHDLGPAGSAAAKAEYGRLIALWARDPGAVTRPAGEYLISALCRDWLASSKAPTERRQLDQAGTALKLLVGHHMTTAAAAFGPTHLTAWQEWLCDLRRDDGEKRFNVTYVRALVGVVKRVWRWAVATGRLPAEKWQALLAVEQAQAGDGPGEARSARDVEPANADHVRKTVPHLRPPVRAMVLLQWHTGARPAELCGLRPVDVVRGGTIHIRKVGNVDLDAAGVWAVVLDKHKTAKRGKSRWLSFAGDAQAVLAPFLDRAPEASCFSPKEAMESLRAEQRKARKDCGGGAGGNRKKPSPAPQRQLGDQYTPKSYRQAIERACKRAGVPHWYPYQLRHLTAAEIKAAFGLDAVQATLGHHTRSMAEHYGGRSFALAAEVAKKRGSPGG